MKRGLKAEDLYPIVDQLSPEEQVRLSYYMMQIRAQLGEREPQPAQPEARPGAKLASLPRRQFVKGDPEDLVHLDWSQEWKP